jgi:hypothetical protein
MLLLFRHLEGLLPKQAWGKAATVYHLCEALRGAALATSQPPPRVSQLLEEVPELRRLSEPLNLAEHRAQLAAAFATAAMDLAREIKVRDFICCGGNKQSMALTLSPPASLHPFTPKIATAKLNLAREIQVCDSGLTPEAWYYFPLRWAILSEPGLAPLPPPGQRRRLP